MRSGFNVIEEEPTTTQHLKVGHTTGVFDPDFFSNSEVGPFTFHKNKSVKALWDGTYGFSSLSEKTSMSHHIADVITMAPLSSQLFKDHECWSGRGLNLRPTSRQTGALTAELARRQS